MAYSYLNNMELEEALELFMSKLSSLDVQPGIEEIDVINSLGRITASAVYARISSPHYNASAMDGVALNAGSTFGASDITPVALAEEIDFVRIDTGDPLPDKYDAVVMIEDVIELGEGKIKLISAASPWQHVRQIGEDICANEMIITSYTRIEPSSIGAMLAGGVLKLKVFKKPVAALVPTGDEIVAPTGSPKAGEIIEFNSSIFSAMLKGWGAEVHLYDIVPDGLDLIKEAIDKASRECDVVIVNAGSSAGREDYTTRAISETGEVYLHGIAIKPGKPTILGAVNNKPVIGVPGYPVSGIIVFEQLVKRVVERFTGMEFPQSPEVKAVLSRRVMSSLKYKEFIRLKLGSVGDKLIATPLNRGAGVISSFVKADGIMEIPLNSEGIEAGEEINVSLLKSRKEILNTLVVIGSHDPLIDEAADVFRRRYNRQFVSSAHVGSLGGIMAVKRGEAHAAGIHLLDEKTGGYNTTYVEKYFSKGEICIVKGVKRIQGFMTAPGNPLKIKSINDIRSNTGKDQSIRYVNRQKGSGTRILLDYMLKNEGISSSDIYGYDREEFTHMSVAALVASGSVDAGMGIFSAARAYNLDFIPICEEQYDFIIPSKFIDLKLVQDFIETLKSDEFKALLERMGGYSADDIGSVVFL